MTAGHLFHFAKSRHTYWIIVSIFLSALWMPLIIDVVPPLLDYPIHLARSYIILEHENNPILRDIFSVNWRPLPNLASDIILYFVGRFLSIEMAGRVLIGLCVLLTLLGVIILHRVNFGYWGWWPFLAAIPTYHGALTAGFINYSIGIAFVSVFLAIANSIRDYKTFSRLTIHSIMALILFFCHILSVGLFGVFLFFFELQRLIDKKIKSVRILSNFMISIIVPFIYPAILYFKYSFQEVIERDDPNILGAWDFDTKIRGALMPFVSGDYLIDIATFAVFTIIFACLIYFKSIILCRDWALGVAMVTLIFIVLPGQALDAAFISDRLPIVIVLVGIASTDPTGIKFKHAALLAVLVLAVTMIRVSSITVNWIESGRYYHRLTLATDSLERGSSVMILSPMTTIKNKGVVFWHNTRMRSPDWHFALLNIPNLHAYAAVLLTKRMVFSQLHFVWADKQILSLTERYRDLDFGDGGNSTWDPSIIMEGHQSDEFIRSKLDRFDYYLIVYADKLSAELKSEIDSRSPVYQDEDLILLKAPTHNL